MKLHIYQLILFIIALSFMFYATNAKAQTLSNTVDMNFNDIEVAAGPGGGGAQLGTDGSIIYSGNFSGNGIGTPANTVIGDTVGLVVDIGCDKGATLEDSTGSSSVKLAIGATVGAGNTAPYSGLTMCARINKVILSHTITGVTSQDTLMFGGNLSLNKAPSVYGTHNTSNAGGIPFTIRVVYQ